jgi:hypothetical protein
MATKEEVIEKYLEDRKRKLIQLYSILAARIGEDIRKKSFVERNGGVGIITTTYSAESFYTQEQAWNLDKAAYTGDEYGLSLDTPVTNKVIEKLNSPNEPIGYISIQPIISYEKGSSFSAVSGWKTSDNTEVTTVSSTIIQTVYLKLPNQAPETIDLSLFGVPGKFVARSFEELSIKLSSIQYPINELQQHQKFKKYLDLINEQLKGKNLLPINQIVGVILPSIQFENGTRTGQFTAVIPPPDGWEPSYVLPTPSVPQPPGLSGTSGVSGTLGTTGLSGTSGISGAVGTTGISGASSTSSVEDNRKYTSVEAVKDDRVEKQNQGTAGTSGQSSGYKKLALGNEWFTDGSKNKYAENSINFAKLNALRKLRSQRLEDEAKKSSTETYKTLALKSGTSGVSGRTETATEPESQVKTVNQNGDVEVPTSQRGTETPPPPTTGTNNFVAQNQKTEIEKQNTITQRLNEIVQRLVDAKSIQKEAPKLKATPSVILSNPGIPDGKTAKVEENTRGNNPGETPKPNKPAPKLKPFGTWKSEPENKDTSNGIYFRKTIEKKGGITTNIEPQRYKNLFNYGEDVEKMFAETPKPESPYDVALLLNPVQAGIVNKNIPYTFEEGCEIHATITRNGYGTDSIGKKQEGGEGTAGNTNWGYQPFWCGIWVNYCLQQNTNGYEADKDFKNISGCGYAIGMYKQNPVNVDACFATFEADEQESKKGKLWTRKKQLEFLDDNAQPIPNAKTPWGSSLANARWEGSIPYYKECLRQNNAGTGRWPEPQKKLNEATAELNDVNEKIREIDTKLPSLITKRTESAKYGSNNTNFEKWNPNGDGIILYEGITHIGNKWTERGKLIFEVLKKWPGAFITNLDHVEILLAVNNAGQGLFLGGNTGVTSNLSGKQLRNGDQFGVKAGNIRNWGGKGITFIIKRGEKNPWTIGGLGGKLKKTPVFLEYEKRINEEIGLAEKDQRSVITNFYNEMTPFM